MNEAIADALQTIHSLFRYPTPGPVSEEYEVAPWYRPRAINAFLAIPRPELTGDTIHQIIRDDGPYFWAPWETVAYYIPRLLELYAASELVFEDDLYRRLLYEARPELEPDEYGFLNREKEMSDSPMTDAQRQSVRAVIEAVLEERAGQDDECSWTLSETIAFLGAFDAPIEPLLRHLRDHPEPRVRANFCLFVADNLLASSRFGNSELHGYNYAAQDLFLPENAAAINVLFTPDAVVELMLREAEEVERLFGAERAADVGLAFDFAAGSSS